MSFQTVLPSVHDFELIHKFKHRYSLYFEKWAVVVAQLTERSLIIPEIRGSIPVIGKILKQYF